MKTIRFLHSGDMGDIIAGLAAVKEYCEKNDAKAVMLLDTTGGKDNSICVDQSRGLGLKFNARSAEFLRPLIEVQPYIEAVDVSDSFGGFDAYIDLNVFRMGLRKPWRLETGKNLLYNHQKALGLNIRWTGPWLTIQGAETKYEWLACRSSRYHSSDEIFKKHLNDFNAFVGTPLERECFRDCFRIAPPRVETNSALELAGEIASSRNFVVNGTLAYWIALGVGHPHIVHEVGMQIPSTVFREDIPGLEYAQGKGIKSLFDLV